MDLALVQGEWVTNSRNYDGAMCKALGWERVNSRYYDAIAANGRKTEVKKMKTGSMFLNMVVYAEMKLNPELADSDTLFLRYKGDRGTEYFIVNTMKLVDYVIPRKELAELILLEHEVLGRKNRNQYPITLKEIKKLAGV